MLRRWAGCSREERRRIVAMLRGRQWLVRVLVKVSSSCFRKRKEPYLSVHVASFGMPEQPHLPLPSLLVVFESMPFDQ